MNITEINTAILQGTFTNTQLMSIVDAVRFAQARLREDTKRGLRIGDAVSFRSSKTGQTYRGTVRKIAIKFVTVDTGQTLWRVPANMIEFVDAPEFA
jgi:uncharacterized protein YwbE